MKVMGLNNRQYSWNLLGYEPSKTETRPRSSLHVEVRAAIRECYPVSRILEEVHIPGCGKLYADFYLPQVKLMVEAHGRQHFTYVPHFHGSPAGFKKSKLRDKNKSEWCELNNITLVICSEGETSDEWKRKLKFGRTITENS